MGKPIEKTIRPFLKDTSKTTYPHNTSLKLYKYVDDIMIFKRVNEREWLCSFDSMSLVQWLAQMVTFK